MADDFAGLDVASITKDALARGGEAKISTGGDPDAIARFMADASAAYTMGVAQQKVIARADSEITAMRQDNLQSQGAIAAEVGAIKGDTAATATEATRQVQLQNAAVREAAGLDIASVLGNSIAEINARTDSAVINLSHAEEQRSKTLLGAISGKNTLAEWADAAFVNPAKDYDQKAQLDMKVAALETKRIADLQHLYTGQAQANASSSVTLAAGAAADAKQLEVLQATKDLTIIRESSLALGSEYTKRALSQSQHNVSAASQQASLGISGEVAKRQYAAFAAKTDDVEMLSKSVRVALRAAGRPDADIWTPEYVTDVMKTPQGKAQVLALAGPGSHIIGHATLTPDQPLPSAFGTPGEVANMLTMLRSTIPGTEKFKIKFDEVNAKINADPMNMQLKPNQRADAFNGNISNWLSKDVTANVDASPYGQPSLEYMVSMQSMHTPEVTPWTTKVLTPLAASVKNISAQALWDATVASGLSLQEQVAGLNAYGVSAGVAVDANNKPQLMGLPSGQSLPYTGIISGTSKLGLGSSSVNFKDTKALANALFRANMGKVNARELMFGDSQRAKEYRGEVK